MTQFVAGVYAPPGPGMPEVAVIATADGKVIFAQGVRSESEGEALLVHMLNGMKELADRDEKIAKGKGKT